MKEKHAPRFTGLWLAVMTSFVIALTSCVGLVGTTNNAPPPGLKKINHVIFMAQENRGFDHYFGAIRQ
jgi:phospholipase C